MFSVGGWSLKSATAPRTGGGSPESLARGGQYSLRTQSMNFAETRIFTMQFFRPDWESLARYSVPMPRTLSADNNPLHPTGMEPYVSLTALLKNHFSSNFDDLPQELQSRLIKHHHTDAEDWDFMCADGRRQWAATEDFNHNPATEGLRERITELANQEDSVKQKIAQWEVIPARNAAHLQIKEQAISTLQGQLSDVYLELQRLSATGSLEVPPATTSKEHKQKDHDECVAASSEHDGGRHVGTTNKMVKDQPVGSPSSDLKPEVGSPEWRSQIAREGANALHSKPNGSRDKRRQMVEAWLSGK